MNNPPPGLVPPRGPPGMAIPPGFPPHLRPPPMMMMGGGGGPPTMSAPGTVHVQPPTVALPVEGSITVFVGSLATDLHDAHIRGILEKCGVVEFWKRAIDPVSEKPKGFGYCTYSNVVEAMRAIRLLNGFCVDSRNIIIKPDNSIQEKLESYQAMIPDTKRREQEHQDYLAKLELDKVFKERSGLFGGKQNHVDSWGDLVPDDVDQPTIESTDGVAVLRNNMIMSEIEKFRSNQDKERKHMEEKQREAVQARLRREKEEKEAKIVLEQKEAVSKQLDELAATSVSYPGKEDKEVEETQRRRRSSRERSYSPDRRRRKRYSRSRSRDRDRRRRRYDDDDDDHDRRRRRRSDERRESNPTSEKTKVVIGMKLQRTSSSTLRKETSHAAIFKVDEDAEMKPLRALVPLDYTEEEKLATAPLKDRVAASLATVSSRADGKKLKGEDYVKELIDNLPTSSKGLFAYHIDWLVVQQHEIVEKKMKPWIQKKIIEYLGEEEASLIEFIAAKLNNRARPDDIEFELKAILDSDAEIFMKLLWRKLIFESIRAKEGL